MSSSKKPGITIENDEGKGFVAFIRRIPKWVYYVTAGALLSLYAVINYLHSLY